MQLEEPEVDVLVCFGQRQWPRCLEIRKCGAFGKLLEGQIGTQNSSRRVERGEAGDRGKESLVCSGV